MAAVSYAKTKLKQGGVLMIIEPYANDEVSKNFNIIGQMYYSFSTIACVPASKSQKGGMALGAQAGLKKLTNVLNNGGPFMGSLPMKKFLVTLIKETKARS